MNWGSMICEIFFSSVHWRRSCVFQTLFSEEAMKRPSSRSAPLWRLNAEKQVDGGWLSKGRVQPYNTRVNTAHTPSRKRVQAGLPRQRRGRVRKGYGKGAHVMRCVYEKVSTKPFQSGHFCLCVHQPLFGGNCHSNQAVWYTV